MNQNLGKGLKPFVLKCMALLMGICYLANPMHQQIRTVFHEISHWVEPPESILSHDSHTADHDHGFHHHEKHHLTSPDHRHAVLDLMDSLFAASDEPYSENDTVLPFIKWDKHIASPDYSLPQLFPLSTSHDHGTLKQKVRKGYLILLDEPPRHHLPSL